MAKKLNAGLAAYLAKKKSGKVAGSKTVANYHATKGKSVMNQATGGMMN